MLANINLGLELFEPTLNNHHKILFLLSTKPQDAKNFIKMPRFLLAIILKNNVDFVRLVSVCLMPNPLAYLLKFTFQTEVVLLFGEANY